MIRGRIGDFSQPVNAGTPVFPGDGPVRVTVLDDVSMNLSRIDLSITARRFAGHRGGRRDSPRAHRDAPGCADAAQFLADCGVPLVGVEMPSVDRAPYPAHRILLGAGVPIVENLTNLDAVGAGLFQIVVLPLKLAGGDGLPVRAVGRRPSACEARL